MEAYICGPDKVTYVSHCIHGYLPCPFITQHHSLSLLSFSDRQGECFKHLHHLCFLLLQAISTAVVENSIFIDSILYQQA